MRKAKFIRAGFSLGLATLTAISNPLWRLSLIGLGAIAPLSSIAPAEAATLTNWQFDPSTRELQVTVPEGVTPRYFLLAEPPRIVLDLPNTQIGTVPEQQMFNGAVRQIRVGQFQPGLTRIVIELVADAEFAPGQVELRQEGDRWILRPLLTDGAAVPDVATAPAQSAPIQPAPVQPSPPEVEASDAETTEVIPEPAPSETTAIAPAPTPQPETTAADLGNDLPQLSPASPVPDTSPDTSNSDVPEAIPETTSEVTPESETATDPLPEERSADLPLTDSPSTDSPSANLPPANLPPLEPGALEIPIEPASEVPETLELVPPTAEPEPNAESVAEQFEGEERESDLPAESPRNLANTDDADDAATEPTEAAQEGEASEAIEREMPEAESGESEVADREAIASEDLPEVDEAIALEAEEPVNEAPPPIPELLPATSPPQPDEQPDAREEAVTLEAEVQTEPRASLPESEMQAESEAIALESDEPAPAAIAPIPQIPTALPPATFSTSPSVTVTVPPLGQSASNSPVVETPENVPVAPPSQPLQPAALPPATFSPSPTSQVSVPPVSTIPNPTAAAPASTPQTEDEIEFGQPISRQPTSPPPAPVPTAIAPQENLPENTLPENTLPDQNIAVAPTPPNILLPSGTVLSLRYPGETSLSLESGVPRQEVLLLDQPVRDRNGNLIAEVGTQVVGRFETGSQGSQFIVQAITLQGQNILLEAESETLAGDREVSEDSLIQNSALGALALTVLGGFTGIGLLGGLAAGAGATYLTAPQPAIIQPNQIVEVRLTEDLPRP